MSRRLPAVAVLLALLALAFPGVARAVTASTASAGATAIGASAVVSSPADRREVAGPGASRQHYLLLATGVRATDVSSSTPNLECLATSRDTAALSVRSTTGRTSAFQGFTTVGTGARAPATGQGGPGDPPPLLGSTLRAGGVPGYAFGPGAALALRLPDGSTARQPVGASGSVRTGPDDAAFEKIVAGLRSLRTAGTDRPFVALADIGRVGSPETTTSIQRNRQLRQLDARLGEALGALGGCRGSARIAFASIGDGSSTGTEPGTKPHLELLAGPSRGDGNLTSGSTRQPGLVQLVDLLPTLVTSAGLAVPPNADGARITPTARGAVGPLQAAGLERTHDLTLGAEKLLSLALPVAISAALLVGLGFVLCWRRKRAGPLVLTFVAALPAATFPIQFLPWWRFDPAWPIYLGALLALMAGLTAIAWLSPIRRFRFGPAGAIGLFTTVILLGDPVTGSVLQTNALMASQPTIAGRFYGINNPTFGFLLAGAFVFLLWFVQAVASRRARLAVVGLVGGGVTVLCLSPSVGADFGSALAALPAFGLLALLLSGLRVRVWHVVGVGFAAVLAVSLACYLDYLRPPDRRTHLGRFAERVIDGEALPIIARKLEQNVGLLLGFPLAFVVPILGVALTLAVLVPARLRLAGLAEWFTAQPEARFVLGSLSLGAWIGFFANDTGTTLLVCAIGIALVLVVASRSRSERLR